MKTKEIGWETTFGGMQGRFQDTVHSMFRLIEAQKQNIAKRAIELKRAGKRDMRLLFEDPMQPFKDVFAQLLAPKELADLSARDQRLQYLEDGTQHDFSTLSSGEREVVNIAFDFLLRNPQDCVIFFDEPELHLHPELSYRLIQTLQSIGARNQFFLSTHSPDVITASLDRSVIFLTVPRETSEGVALNQAVPVSDADETNQALKLLGQSIGIIALGKRLVLIEGEHSSLDKQVYGSITRNRFPTLVLVPSGGKHILESFSAVYEAVLSRSLWGVEFFMICDADSAPPSALAETAAATKHGRLRVLSKYHLENYFLDEVVWAKAFEPMEPATSWLRSPQAIRTEFLAFASGMVSYATALAVASKLRLSVGNVDIMPADCHGKDADQLTALIRNQASSETGRVAATLDPETIRANIEAYFEGLSRSLANDTDDWKALIPGKPLLGQFASKAGVPMARAKLLYINAAEAAGRTPFQEIFEILTDFANFGAVASP